MSDLIWNFIENNNELILIIFYSGSELGNRAVTGIGKLATKVLPVLVTKEICETFQFVRAPRYEFWYQGSHIRTEIGFREVSELNNLILKLKTEV